SFMAEAPILWRSFRLQRPCITLDSTWSCGNVAAVESATANAVSTRSCRLFRKSETIHSSIMHGFSFCACLLVGRWLLGLQRKIVIDTLRALSPTVHTPI